jgi:hypothetical protein
VSRHLAVEVAQVAAPAGVVRAPAAAETVAPPVVTLPAAIPQPVAVAPRVAARSAAPLEAEVVLEVPVVVQAVSLQAQTPRCRRQVPHPHSHPVVF